MTIKEMTTEALEAAARKHRADEFGGGDGYNRYQSELDHRQDSARINSPRNLRDVIHDLMRLDCSIARENGTYDADKVAELKKERAELDIINAQNAAL